MKPEYLEIVIRYAKEHQYDITSIILGNVIFKEYDGDGYFRIKKTVEEIRRYYGLKA